MDNRREPEIETKTSGTTWSDVSLREKRYQAILRATDGIVNKSPMFSSHQK
ncbi:MAG: hypothetical protein KDA96_01455 [Planctomycetaceae bacterium]|nr:hypothetical protein [Planctomycetaceae bacterium]